VSAALAELEQVWAQFVQDVASFSDRHDRVVVLRRDDGSEEALFLSADGSEWLQVERSGAEVEFQAETLREPERCVSLLTAAIRNSRERDQRPLLFPEAVEAVRTHLADAGLDAPELVLWEIYRPAQPGEKKGV
jgi:hypothetical protein